MSTGISSNGAAASASVIVYFVKTGRASRLSAVHVRTSTRPLGFKPFAFWKAVTARSMFVLDRPSISPGENQAWSSRACVRTTSIERVPAVIGAYPAAERN